MTLVTCIIVLENLRKLMSKFQILSIKVIITTMNGTFIKFLVKVVAMLYQPRSYH